MQRGRPVRLVRERRVVGWHLVPRDEQVRDDAALAPSMEKIKVVTTACHEFLWAPTAENLESLAAPTDGVTGSTSEAALHLKQFSDGHSHENLRKTATAENSVSTKQSDDCVFESHLAKSDTAVTCADKVSATNCRTQCR